MQFIADPYSTTVCRSYYGRNREPDISGVGGQGAKTKRLGGKSERDKKRNNPWQNNVWVANVGDARLCFFLSRSLTQYNHSFVEKPKDRVLTLLSVL